MSTAFKSEHSQGTLVRFPRRESVQLDSDLKAFLDEVVIPMLIREAVEDIRRENLVELQARGVEDCARVTVIGEAAL
jgi:hypothetical protein